MTPSGVVETKSSLREIRDIQDLIEIIEMSDIQFYEVCARRNESFEESEDKEIEPTFLLQIGHPANGIGIRLTVEFASNRGTIRVDVGVIYTNKTKEERISFPDEIGLDFANRVGVLALIPFIRESVANLSLRVFGKSINLPLFRAGQLTFHQSDYQMPDANPGK